MKKFLVRIAGVLDFILPILVYPSAWVLKNIRRAGVFRLPRCKAVLLKMGVFPLINHYYEPQFDYRDLRRPLSGNRTLPGIDWNTGEQLDLLSRFSFSGELTDLQEEFAEQLEFHLNNDRFESGDAEYWYQIIRLLKPSRIFEIGSGFSTLMAIKAIDENKRENPSYACKHVCFEPYERAWLEETSASIVRQKIEAVDLSCFDELGENDILFIDSSHMIRPQGDVLFEYLELLPRLNEGVIVHVHDIFSPKDYPREWLEDKVLFWNEQYLLEAFLTNNANWKIIGSLNYLKNNHFEELKAVAPALSAEREPGSFYMQKKRA